MIHKNSKKYQGHPIPPKTHTSSATLRKCFYLVKRLIITTNSVVKFVNLVMNHESQSVKLNPLRSNNTEVHYIKKKRASMSFKCVL